MLFFSFKETRGDLLVVVVVGEVGEVGKGKSGLLELDVPCHLLHT